MKKRIKIRDVSGVANAGKMATHLREGAKAIKKERATFAKQAQALGRALKDMQKKASTASKSGFTRQTGDSMKALAKAIQDATKQMAESARLMNNAGRKAVSLAKKEGYAKAVNEAGKDERERKGNTALVKKFEQVWKRLETLDKEGFYSIGFAKPYREDFYDGLHIKSGILELLEKELRNAEKRKERGDSNDKREKAFWENEKKEREWERIQNAIDREEWLGQNNGTTKNISTARRSSGQKSPNNEGNNAESQQREEQRKAYEKALKVINEDGYYAGYYRGLGNLDKYQECMDKVKAVVNATNELEQRYKDELNWIFKERFKKGEDAGKRKSEKLSEWKSGKDAEAMEKFGESDATVKKLLQAGNYVWKPESLKRIYIKTPVEQFFNVEGMTAKSRESLKNGLYYDINSKKWKNKNGALAKSYLARLKR